MESKARVPIRIRMDGGLQEWHVNTGMYYLYSNQHICFTHFTEYHSIRSNETWGLVYSNQLFEYI